MQALFSNPRFTAAFLRTLPEYLGRQRWFMSKGKVITDCDLVGAYRVTSDTVLAVINVDFEDESQEIYQMPLAQLAHTEDQMRYLKEHAELILMKVPGGVYIVDAVPLPAFRTALYALVRDGAYTQDGLNCEAGKILRTAPASGEDRFSLLPALRR